MIKKFTFGKPFETNAVIKQIERSKDALPFGNVTTKKKFTWTYTLLNDDIIFGLGETMRGINKRGFEFISWNTDKPIQDESVKSLYGSHNFIIIFGKNTFGIFFDYPGRISFDLGFSKSDTLKVEAVSSNIDVYFITAQNQQNTLVDIVHQFREIIGQSYIPPRWAFGFCQSRWGYKNVTDIENVVNQYKKLNIPLDSICMDIDYMKDYEDFTVDKEKFPDFIKFVSKLKKDGVHLVPLVDAGVKVLDGYEIYDEIKQNNFACKEKDGKDFIAGVWPGDAVFPDYLNEDTQKWFGQKFKFYTDLGLEGFWLDMNEPATFYSKQRLKEAFKKIDSFKGKPLDIESFFEFKNTATSIDNNIEDTKLFYHKVPQKVAGGFACTPPDKNGNVLVRHDSVHNIFGFNMTRATSNGLKEIEANKRYLLYSRSSYIGAHRYAGIWTGDNHAYWNDILLSLHQLASLNMTGFLWTGSDIGGFNDDTSRDLLLRWLAFGIFSPLCRNHNAKGARSQEFYEFENPEDFKSILDLRYALLPYIYSEFIKAAISNEMYFRPLAFDYIKDERAIRIEDQIMLGDALMIAPVYVQNAQGRMVYIPENMIKVVWQNDKIVLQEKIKKGDHYIEMPLNAVVFFVKQNHIVPLCAPTKNTSKIDTSHFDFIGDTQKGVSYKLYEDDGNTKDIKLKENIRSLTI